MKGYTEQELCQGRPSVSVGYAIDHCLKCLFDDRTHDFTGKLTDGIGLSYEELIGTLLLARDLVNLFEERNSDIADGMEDATTAINKFGRDDI
jgi:hypothetical protein